MGKYEFQSEQDEILDIKGAVSFFLRRIWIIILCTLLAGCITLGIARLVIPKKYESYVLFNIGNSALIESYSVIVTSAPVMEEVANQAGIDYEYEQLSSMVTSSSVGGTEILRITVEDKDPEKAQLIANAITEVFPGRIGLLYPGNGISVVQSARRPTVCSYPNYKSIFSVACFVGALLSFAGLVIYYFINDSIRSVDDLVQRYRDIPLLAVIPGDKKPLSDLRKRFAKRGYKGSASGNTAEAFRFMRNELRYLFPKAEKGHVIGITSAEANEGKDIISINTAATLAVSAERILLIDGDMRSSVIAKQLGINTSPGLSDMLTDNVPLDQTIRRYKINSGKHKSVSIDVLSSGSMTADAGELSGSRKLERIIDILRSRYDQIIVDLPPAAENADTQALARLIDGIVVVVRKDVTSKSALAEALRRIELVKGNIIGFVCNEGQDTVRK